jgi:acyl-CoA thioesterase
LVPRAGRCAGPGVLTPSTGEGKTVEEADAVWRAQQQAAAMHERDVVSHDLDIRVSEVAPGLATAHMLVTPAMVNGYRMCHGGYLFLLADTAFAYACNTHGVPVVAAGADVTFLAPAWEGDELVATATERALRGRSGVYDVTVRRGTDAVVEFRGRSRALPADPNRR